MKFIKVHFPHLIYHAKQPKRLSVKHVKQFDNLMSTTRQCAGTQENLLRLLLLQYNGELGSA
jgi:hypothetical protein